MLQHLVAGPWHGRLVSAARRTEEAAAGVPHLAVDLLDRAAALRTFAKCTDITHLIYASRQWQPLTHDELNVNVQLLTNTVESILEVGAPYGM